MHKPTSHIQQSQNNYSKAIIANLNTSEIPWPFSTSLRDYTIARLSEHRGITYLSLFFFFALFFFFFFWLLGLQLWHMEVLRLQVNQSWSCWPTPQPQQCRIWAAFAIYTTALGNAISLNHWAKPEIEPASSWKPVVFVNCWATTGTPTITFFTYYYKTN